MVQLNKLGFGGCLADDMGLGKTLQTLTLLQYIYKPAVPEAAGHSETVPAALSTSDDHLALKQTADTEGQFSLFSFSSGR